MKYVPHISQTMGELRDKLAYLMGGAPGYEDDLGYYDDKDIEKVFGAWYESLDVLRKKLGEERYSRVRALTAEARTHFDNAPDEDSERFVQGMHCLLAIDELLRARKPGAM